MAELLGAPQLVVRLTDLQRSADALITEQLPIPADSPFAGRPLGDTQARTRTGASIVAVLRGGTTHPSPGPDFVLRGRRPRRDRRHPRRRSTRSRASSTAPTRRRATG